MADKQNIRLILIYSDKRINIVHNIHTEHLSKYDEMIIMDENNCLKCNSEIADDRIYCDECLSKTKEKS